MPAIEFAEKIFRLEVNLKNASDAYELVGLMHQVLELEPGLIEGALQGNYDVAREKMGQVRDDYGALVYPVEIAIRHLANQINYFGATKDSLSPRSWSARELIDFLKIHSGGVVELAGTHNISVNLPHRSAHIFAHLNALGIIDEPLVFIELGTSGGFLLSGLLRPQLYKKWAVKQDNFEVLEKVFWDSSIFNRQMNFGFGVDLSLPERSWVISCVGDDLARSEMLDFIDTVGMIERLYKMNALDVFSDDGRLTLGEDIPDGTRPIVVACAMLYQLDAKTRSELENKIYQFIKPRNGLFVVTNQARCEGYPDKDLGSLSYVKDGSGNIVSERWHVSGNKMLNWSVFKG